MKIINQGLKEFPNTKVFICDDCDCVFECENREYKKVWRDNEKITISDCPNCGEEIIYKNDEITRGYETDRNYIDPPYSSCENNWSKIRTECRTFRTIEEDAEKIKRIAKAYDTTVFDIIYQIVRSVLRNQKLLDELNNELSQMTNSTK